MISQGTVCQIENKHAIADRVGVGGGCIVRKANRRITTRNICGRRSCIQQGHRRIPPYGSRQNVSHTRQRNKYTLSKMQLRGRMQREHYLMIPRHHRVVAM